MKKILFLMLPAFLFLASCKGGFKEVEFQGIENVKIDKADKENFTIVMDAKIYNPNTFNIKIKPSELDLFVGSQKLGKARITNFTTLKKLEQGNYPFRVEGKWKDLVGGGLGGVLGMITKKKIDLTMKGDLRVGAFGLSKKIPVDHTKTVDLSELKGMM